MSKVSLCVYCGSGLGDNPIFAEAAKELGRCLAQRDIQLIYGGANIGIMGVIASEVLAHGGEVSGVMPDVIADREIAHTELTRLYRVASMHERKAKMMQLCDGVIAMPGGLGTLEELFEAMTWAQLTIHSKPCALLNTHHYYDKLLEFLQQGINQGFVKKHVVDSMVVESDANRLLENILVRL